jgi:hypothetical protein
MGSQVKAMDTLTQKSYNNLVYKIYESLMSNEDFGLGEMGSSMDESERIVDEWVQDNNIYLIKESQ